MKILIIIIVLSAGTVYKAPPLDEDGFPIFESIAAAKYLVEQGINPDMILCETSSYDTVGNAYFSRVIHVDPQGCRRLHIITSAFHMPRTKAIFEWLYSLDCQGSNYQLTFDPTPDIGITDADLQARVNKEAESLSQFQKIQRQSTLYRPVIAGSLQNMQPMRPLQQKSR